MIAGRGKAAGEDIMQSGVIGCHIDRALRERNPQRVAPRRLTIREVGQPVRGPGPARVRGTAKAGGVEAAVERGQYQRPQQPDVIEKTTDRMPRMR